MGHDVAAERHAHEALQCYTLAHGSAAFIHQHVVDAWTAQHATAETKPIALTFALVGLYLHVDRGWTGRQVQRAHQHMARRKREWPAITLPADCGAVTAVDVMAAAEGPDRDRVIDEWCRSVWSAYRDSHATVAALIDAENP